MGKMMLIFSREMMRLKGGWHFFSSSKAKREFGEGGGGGGGLQRIGIIYLTSQYIGYKTFHFVSWERGEG